MIDDWMIVGTSVTDKWNQINIKFETIRRITGDEYFINSLWHSLRMQQIEIYI
jgi:hypothetical protein